jgi:hypothetical protein
VIVDTDGELVELTEFRAAAGAATRSVTATTASVLTRTMLPPLIQDDGSR